MSIVERSSTSSDPAYESARLRWRAKLTDYDCRSMAYEYKVALAKYKKNEGPPPDDCLVDAWAEYETRFGGSPRSEFVSKRKAVRSKKKDRAQRGSLSRLYNQSGELI